MRRRWTQLFALYLICSLAAPFAEAATFTWSGGGSDNNWSTGANWSGGAPPGATGSVLFNSTSTKNATIDPNIKVLSINIGPGYTGTITQSGSVQVGTGGYIQGGGTFTGGSRPILVWRNLTLTGGTLTSTSNVLSLSGSFTRTGGTFNANGGIVTLAGPAGRALSAAGVTFNRLDIESTNETGLAGYWKLNESVIASGSGDTYLKCFVGVVRDYSGNGYDGCAASTPIYTSAHAPTYSSDSPPTGVANGGSLSFNGFRSWVQSPLKLNIGPSSTIAAWLKVPASLLTTQQVFLSNAHGSSANWLWILAQGNTNKIIFDNCGGYGGTTTDTFMNDGGWHHIAVVYDGNGGTCSVYFDGSFSTSYSRAAASVGSGVEIGNDAQFDAIGIQGKMADVRVYNRVLTASQIATLYKGFYPVHTAGSTLTLSSALQTGTLNLFNGTLNANGNTVTATSLTTLSGGNYSASTAAQSFNGGLTFLGGTLTGGAGSVGITGALSFQSGALLASSGNMTVTGSYTQTGGLLSGSTGLLTITGNLALRGGSMLAPSTTLSVAGNWTLGAAASFGANNGTVTLNGTSQTLSGSTTFYTLTKSVTSADTLTFVGGQLNHVPGTLTLKGAAGNALSLRSSITGARWFIDPPSLASSRTISYVNVKDSNNAGSLKISCPAIASSCTDAGNNDGWDFSEPVSNGGGGSSDTTSAGTGGGGGGGGHTRTAGPSLPSVPLTPPSLPVQPHTVPRTPTKTPAERRAERLQRLHQPSTPSAAPPGTSRVSPSSTPPATPAAGTQYQVMSHGLNVRWSASLTAPVRASLTEGNQVTVLGITGNWAHVRLPDGREGYVGTKMLTKVGH